jgi:hypothetical protein
MTTNMQVHMQGGMTATQSAQILFSFVWFEASAGVAVQNCNFWVFTQRHFLVVHKNHQKVTLGNNPKVTTTFTQFC